MCFWLKIEDQVLLIKEWEVINNSFDLFHTDIPPPYEEAIKIKSIDNTMNNSSHPSSLVPIHSISLSVDQAATISNTSGEIPNRKRNTPSLPSQPS